MKKINRYYTKILFAIFAITWLITSGCKKSIEVDAPVTGVNASNVYTNEATAASVLTGICARISNLDNDLGLAGITGLSLYTSLSADELSLYNLGDQRLPFFYTNNLSSLTAASASIWSNCYQIIFIANSAIDGLNNSSLRPSVKQQLIGEAKFMRAFCYFYLVNLYGDVPLVIGTDYLSNLQLPRRQKTQVYQQIISDLKEAQGLLSSSYLNSDAVTAYANGSEEKVRPTKWVANALLSRVYLYTGDYTNAELQASSLIDNSSPFKLASLDNAFLKNSVESIWQLQPVGTGVNANTGAGKLFVLPAAGPNNSDYPVYLNNNLIKSFEQGDLRRSKWIDSVLAGGNVYFYSKKFKIGKVNSATAEYIMLFRLGEQYLIRAEARAQQNNIVGAQSDLNAIRNRAGLQSTLAADKNSLLTAVFHERQVELFTELGHRWFDLRRSGSIDAVMSVITPQKGGTWSPYKALYPIPQDDLTKDPSLVQNPGY